MCVCSVTLDLISSSVVFGVFVIIIISVIFIRNFILPGIRYIEISTGEDTTARTVLNIVRALS